MSLTISEQLQEQSKIPLDLSKISARTFLDIPYAVGGVEHQLDIALPAEGDGPFPVVIFLHGGGWHYGDKRNVHTGEAWENIPSAGFALVSVNYRLSHEAIWPAQIYDVKAAVRFIRAHAEQYMLKTDKIGVWGKSAGGQLAAVLAASGGNPGYEDLSMGNSEFSSEVQAAMVWYGMHDFGKSEEHWSRILKEGETRETEDFNAEERLLGGPVGSDNPLAAHASARTLIHPSMPPMYLVHGTADRVVPYLQSVEFFEEYIRQNDDEKIHLELLEGAGHGGPRFWDERVIGSVQSFFRSRLV